MNTKTRLERERTYRACLKAIQSFQKPTFTLGELVHELASHSGSEATPGDVSYALAVLGQRGKLRINPRRAECPVTYTRIGREKSSEDAIHADIATRLSGGVVPNRSLHSYP